jgi:hypothetical protein
MLKALLHNADQEAVTNLMPLLDQVGFVELRSGDMGILSLGFVVARAADQTSV